MQRWPLRKMKMKVKLPLDLLGVNRTSSKLLHRNPSSFHHSQRRGQDLDQESQVSGSSLPPPPGSLPTMLDASIPFGTTNNSPTPSHSSRLSGWHRCLGRMLISWYTSGCHTGYIIIWVSDKTSARIKQFSSLPRRWHVGVPC